MAVLLVCMSAAGACASELRFASAGDAQHQQWRQRWHRFRELLQAEEWEESLAELNALATVVVDPAVSTDNQVGVDVVALDAAFGVVYHNKRDLAQAQRYYERALARQPNDTQTLGNLALVYYDQGEPARAIELLQRAVVLDAALEQRHAHMLAVAHHHNGDFATAERYYESIPVTDHSATLLFDYGVTLERLGKLVEASNAYNAALLIDSSLATAWHNVAALHQQYGDVNMSIPNYLRVLSLSTATPALQFMAMMNVGVAYEQMSDVRRALDWYARALQFGEQPRSPDTREPLASEEQIIALAVHAGRAKRSACLWQNMERDADALIDRVVHGQLDRGLMSALLPFDTLMLAMDPRVRLRIARAHSDGIVAVARKLQLGLGIDSERTRPLAVDASRRLRVAYVSYDFSDHPTTHLMEGLFATHDRARIEVLAFGYGRDDGSAFRRRALAQVDAFVNLADASTAESVRAIAAHGVHIFMDAQGHTRGTRSQLAAARPAPIVVNYLVYPGSSGASYVDYVIADRDVAPPDVLASHFSEKLVLLPHSYQVNYYAPHHHVSGDDSASARSALWSSLRNDRVDISGDDDNRDANETGEFLFVNFNKIDKLEPHVFTLWLAVLRRVPRSRLLLLDPVRGRGSESGRHDEVEEAEAPTTSAEIKRNLVREAAAHGIAATRIQFVPRVSKREHLRRHRHGGLFLDTFVYGAHSTATDALYAGLPVLTLAGDAFASRVGVSLLANVGIRELVAFSRMEFEDMAVDIALDRRLHTSLKAKLRQPEPEAMPLFRTREHVATLEAAQCAMATVYAMRAHHRPAHIVVLPC